MSMSSMREEIRTELGCYDGYVPNFFPDEHFGDYVMLDIDVKSGKILNWKVPTQKQLNDLIK